MENKSIVIPILNHEYKVIVCWGDETYVKKILKTWHNPTPEEFNQVDLKTNRGQCYYKKTYHPVIALPKFPQTASQIGTLAHEVTHAITNIFEAINEKSSDEIFAHSVGAVVRAVLERKDKND